MSEQDQGLLKTAHKASSYHRKSIEASDVCGCFYCCRQFAPSKIREWVDKGQTAICPLCGIDSVIGAASGYQISDDFLKQMCEFWF